MSTIWHSTGTLIDRQRSFGVGRRATVSDLRAVDFSAVPFKPNELHLNRWQLEAISISDIVTAESRRLSPGNFIHQVLSIQSELVTSEKIALAYRIFSRMVNEVKGRFEPKNDLPATEKIKLVYEVIADEGFKYRKQKDVLFVSCLLSGNLVCESSSLVALAVAREFNWPVTLVPAGEHALIRWDDGKTRVHIDMGRVYQGVDHLSVDDIVSLDDNGIVSLSLQNRADAKRDLGREAEAIADYHEAIKIWPSNANAIFNLGCAELKLERCREALDHFEAVLRLEPWNAYALCACGTAKNGLGLFTEAIIDFDESIKLCEAHPLVFSNESLSIAFNNRGNAKENLGLLLEAKADYERALEKDPSDPVPKAGIESVNRKLTEAQAKTSPA